MSQFTVLYHIISLIKLCSAMAKDSMDYNLFLLVM